MSPQVRSPGAPTLKSRLTRSGSGGALTSGVVVRTLLAPAVLGVEAVGADQALDPLVVDAVAPPGQLVGHAGAAVGVVVAEVDLPHGVDQDRLVPLGLGRSS